MDHRMSLVPYDPETDYESLESKTMVEINVEVVRRLLGDSKDIYRILTFRGYYLPKFKAKIITKRFLCDVMSGKTWCPLCKDIKLFPEVISAGRAEIIAAIMKKQPRARLYYYQQPDKQWLINLLYTLAPNHKIFDLWQKGLHEPFAFTSLEGKLNILRDL
jgi:hypothetical protein